MDEPERVIVDFILPDPDGKPIRTGLPEQCECGSGQFELVSRMEPDPQNGLHAASRMYECLGCGEYRLGK